MNKLLNFAAGFTMIAFVFILGVYAGKATAETPWLEMHLKSSHAQEGYVDERGHYQPFQEINPGLGVMFPVNRYVEVGFGTYYNSYRKVAVYTGFDLHTPDAIARLGVSVALVSGYTSYQNPIAPLVVLPNLTIGTKDVRLKIGVIPGQQGFVTFTVGVKF